MANQLVADQLVADQLVADQLVADQSKADPSKADPETVLQIKSAIQSLSVEFVKVKPWNETTFKVEISADVFGGVRRLDRFALLNDHLKSQIPEVFSRYSFLYKPFTKEEWVVRNANKLAK